MERSSIIILRTKLQRPGIPSDYVHRPNLVDKLEKNSNLPLVLVSAPAGYGKSTLVSSWLGQCDRASAWVSLDEEDNDLQQFLSYLTVGIRLLFPGSILKTTALVNGSNLPPFSIIASTLINELENIDQKFIIVLDDIHRIHEKPVHEFLNLLMRHPSKSIQLVLVGRRDPMLPLASFRAMGLLTEIRMKDLRFTLEETVEFINRSTGLHIESFLDSIFIKKAEGWIAGLRLWALALQGQDESYKKLTELKGSTATMMDYLISEVLDKQPPGIRDCLLCTSFLNRFCASLCDALLGKYQHKDKEKLKGTEFINHLLKNNLFVISLGNEKTWFRYHHLFEDFLRRQLRLEKNSEELHELYSRASEWFEDQGLMDESIQHALSAGKTDDAADLVEKYGRIQSEEDRWPQVRRWLDHLPLENKKNRPALMMLEARVKETEFHLKDLSPIIEQANLHLKDKKNKPLLHGELFFFQGLMQFWQGNGSKSKTLLGKALKLVPENPPCYLRSMIELYTGLAYLINGQKDEAIEKLNDWIDRRNISTGKLWERLKYGLAIIHLISGNLPMAFRESNSLLEYGKQQDKPYIELWGNYLLGTVSFHWSDLVQAQQHFRSILNSRYAFHFRAAVDSMIGLAITCQLLGQKDEANEAIREAYDYARWTRDPQNMEVVQAGEARAALLRGDTDQAVNLQRCFGKVSNMPCSIFFLANPSITECRVLAALKKQKSLLEASKKLKQLYLESTSLNYTCQTMEILVLQSMVAQFQGHRDDALKMLDEALEIAEPGGWVRPFIELGSPMEDLLKEYMSGNPSSDYPAIVLAAFRNHQPGISPLSSAADSLTQREMDVLELLCEHLQDKEIAEKLTVSPTTVKTHLKHIYQKLHVEKRRQAVSKARSMGILN